MSDNGSNLSRRSSSQASHTSGDSKKPKTLRGAPRRTGSKASATTSTHNHDPSLTSFPSFSPEPEDSKAQSPAAEVPKPVRTISQKVRDRKTTLAGLTSALPTITQQNALFDDSPRSSLEMPGSLHLASDEHIERLIARTGAVKLVRQYAQDLAQRDAEISALRVRADNRERELKRMLRETNVSSADIEKRLLRLERPTSTESGNRDYGSRDQKPTTTLDGMMNEAMSAEMTKSSELNVDELSLPTEASSTLPGDKSTSTTRARKGSGASAQVRASTTSSRTGSRASSIMSQDSEDIEATVRPRVSSTNVNRRSGLQSIFQPPSQPTSYFIGGSRPVKKPKAGDEVSVRSNQSSKSFASWTQIFSGRSASGRQRSSSLDQDGQTRATTSEAESALSSLSKVQTNPSVRSNTPTNAGNAVKSRSSGKPAPTSSRLSVSPNHTRKESNASSLPPTVEMDSMIESSELPPTMTVRNTDTSGVLTDRFGFIYDQRHRRKQHLQVQHHKRNRLSAADTIASFRSGDGSGTESKRDRPSTPVSVNQVDDDAPKTLKSWQDYLKAGASLSVGRPRELLSHTPSATAIVTVNTADVNGTITPTRARERSASVSTAGPQSPSLDTQSPATAPRIAESTRNGTGEELNDSGSSKLLLEQLNELHDSLQAERTVKWNDFLRRVRAEPRVGNNTNNVPEADVLNGELVGIASLARSNNTKNKYMHFKSLVLGGIPVTLRPKIWAECTGASSLHIPGYYEDLVSRSGDVDDITADQIKADVRRTLTDNIFFKQGPGVQRLEEVLRAYALHNTTVGYAQGLNAICGSLLLIMPSASSAFWLLVAIIDFILPSGYFDTLVVARADQLVLRQYVAEILPRLDAKLNALGAELEMFTFHWFTTIYSAMLTGGEACYRVFDVCFALNSGDMSNAFSPDRTLAIDMPTVNQNPPTTPVSKTAPGTSNGEGHEGSGSCFLFQLALSLLSLNEQEILSFEDAAQVYSHNWTNHAISIDALIQASEALRTKIKRSEVLERRAAAVKELTA